MAVYPIEVSMELPPEGLIDIFIIQWHTPLPVQGANWAKIANNIALEKLSLLDKFRIWLMNYFEQNVPARPLFILSPELSMPQSCANLLQDILSTLNRTTTIISGFEYLGWSEYCALVQTVSNPLTPSEWLDGGLPTHIVNAAGIWIRDFNGDIWRYFQPKRNPQDHEQAIPVYPGQYTLFFKSRDQTPGSRLNFCVQVCSDFSSN